MCTNPRCMDGKVPVNHGEALAPCPTCASSRSLAGYKPRYLGGRCWNGSQRDAGTVVHAVEPVHGDNMNKAACGRVPGPRSFGWSESSKPINCPKCIKRLGL